MEGPYAHPPPTVKAQWPGLEGARRARHLLK